VKENIITSLILLIIGVAAGTMVWVEFKRDPKANAGSGNIVLMDFYADWCGPCKMMKPIVHDFANEMAGQLIVREINVDQNPELARQYQVRSIPCFVVTRNGVEINRRSGTMSKEGLRQLAGL
jgi:thioredoxin 1